MSFNPWIKRVRCKQAWAVYSFSVSELVKLLDCDVLEVPVLDRVPMSVADIKHTVQLTIKDNSEHDEFTNTYVVVDNTQATCALCAPGLFGADIVVENISIPEISRPIWMVGVARDSSLTAEHIALLDRYLSPHQLDVCEFEFEDALKRRDDAQKAQSDLARITYEFLSCHPAVGYISYIGSKTHPEYDIASRTLRGGFGSYIDFQLANASPKQLIGFLDEVSSKGLDVELLSVDKSADIGVKTLIRLKSNSIDPISQLSIIESALLPFRYAI